MNRWRSGEGSQKLEYLDMRLTRFSHLKEVLNANGVKHIDASKKPPTHTVPNLFTLPPAHAPKMSPITSHSYMVRETDNRVASVSVQGDKFRFGVWKETEEVFLKLVT